MPEILDFLLEPWRSGIGQRALAEVALVGAIGGALSFWVVTFGLAYGAESLAHGMLPGLVAAALIGAPLVLGALGGVLAAAAAVGLAGRDERIGADTATAVAVSGMLGAGGLVALLPDVPPRLGELLFGDPLSAQPLDLIAAAVLVVAGGLALAAIHRPLTVAAFDPEAARSLGLSAQWALVALLALVGLAVGVAVQGLGNLLVLAVLVAPAVAVRGHATSPLRAMAAGSAAAMVAGMVGIYVSFGLELAAGASVALVLCIAAATGNALAARRKRA